MSIQGAMAASLRRFDPYPEFDNVRVFKGRPETGGRQFYKTAGLIVPRFEMASGVQIVGGAGFGTVQRNGIWTPVPADAPLIGSGGLGGWEARTNSIRNPTGAGAVAGSPGTPPTGWTFSVTPGVNVSNLGTHLDADGNLYTRVRFQGASANTLLTTTIFGLATDAPASAGQTWTGSSLMRLSGGSLENVGSASVRLQAFQGNTYLDQPGVGVGKTLTADFQPLSVQAELTNPSTNGVRVVAVIGAVTGAPIDITVDFRFPNLKLGPDINDPPILQESGLPATRTGYSYQETGRNIQPVHYGVARARLVAPAANHAASFPLLLDIRASSGASRVLWYAQKSDGSQRIRHWGDDGIINTIILPASPVVGEYRTVAWARRAGALVVSRNGETILTTAISAVTSPFSRIGYMGDAATAGADPANAETELVLTQNGEISDAALQALSARYAA